MANTAPYTHQLELGRWMMACQFNVFLNAGQHQIGPEAAMAALSAAEQLELILSVFKPVSEFSRINRSLAGVPTPVSHSTAELISIALQLQSDTDQAFNIAAASLSELWGFSRRAGQMPDRVAVEAAVAAINAAAISVDLDNQSVTRSRDDVRINSGGIGKGYAIDQMGSIMRSQEVTNFLIHGGHSSVLAAGNRLDIDSRDGWRVAVRHPDQQQYVLGELCLRNTALGTSGPANQFFYFNGKRYGHIIDPRTGWPASAMLSITVLNPSATKADALATGLFVLGVERAEAYCRANPDTGFLAILPTKRQGQVEIVSCNLGNDVWRQAGTNS